MGMYTEAVLKFELVPGTPDLVMDVLKYLFCQAPEPVLLPDHQFFQCDRWRMLGTSSSYYHTPWSVSHMQEGYVFSRSDFKAYDEEIQFFVDWIKPYVKGGVGTCIGWEWFEEADTPTLLIIKEGVYGE